MSSLRDFTLDDVPGDVPDGMELADPDHYECRDCGHVHATKAVEPDEVNAFRPGHSDICDCDAPLPMVCRYCGTDTPDDLCERAVCDDPRVP